MRRAAIPFVGIALLASHAAAAPPRLPAALTGHWTDDPAACGGEDTNGVTIRPGAIEWYDAQGTPAAVRVSGRTISATVSYRGEGRSWTERNRFTLSADGKSLAVTALGSSATLRRCPAARG